MILLYRQVRFVHCHYILLCQKPGAQIPTLARVFAASACVTTQLQSSYPTVWHWKTKHRNLQSVLFAKYMNMKLFAKYKTFSPRQTEALCEEEI